MALLFPKILLLLLSVWGFWTLWGFPYTNGLLKILADLSEPGASIPGPTFAPMKQRYTGIRVIDKQFTLLVGFFFTAVDGNRPDVSLSGLALGGQVVTAWVLMTVESLRWGNQRKKLITSLTILGLLLQNVGFACIAPLWLALHLSISPTVHDPQASDLIVSAPMRLAVTPLSVLVAYGIPSLIMSLPAPALISFGAKQTWTGIQQAWPFWIALTQSVFFTIGSAITSGASVGTEADKKALTIQYLRWVYAFGIMISASGQLISVGISMLAYLFPVLFNERLLAMLQPTTIFVPVWPFGPRQAHTLADGALWFIQWDFYTGAAAVLIWGLTLRAAAKRDTATPWQVVAGCVKIAMIVGVLGPAGTAVVGMWARDELVFGRAAREEEATAAKKGS